jgi:hypothetical protein
MNIFHLDEDPILAVQYHHDKHVCKMVTETAQLLSYAYHICNKHDATFMHGIRGAHLKHPCTLWALKSCDNFLWLANFGLALYNEYQHRYDQPTKHQSNFLIFMYALSNVPKSLPNVGLTPFARAIKKDVYPDLLDTELFPSTIEAYREYYRRDKLTFNITRTNKLGEKVTKTYQNAWTKRKKPYWL